ncbi:unnamed protein product [Psylliodes chrysocephalus]|uniref:Uncharacterized protein n=1 Tax=Psylliodes chrysocephalus TaxID=3402493 RepID=A0A9P0CXR9_9CUCU|nr:unnamed protein product [Psylliodes chrysocephala]
MSPKRSLSLRERYICALGLRLNVILKDTENIPSEIKEELLTHLSDAVRLFTNLFHRLTMSRRNCILLLLSENIKEVVEKSHPTDLLFGDNLSEHVKSAKHIVSLSKALCPAPKNLTAVRKCQKKEGGTTY